MAMMTFRGAKISVCSVALALSAGTALGCSPKSPDYNPLPLAVQAKQNIMRADALVDGEIVRLGGYDYKTKTPIPVLLKVRKVFKGPRFSSFSLRMPGGGCEISFYKKEKVRLLLSRNGDSWAALEYLNRPSPSLANIGDHLVDYRLPYARAIDKQIGSSRSSDTAIAPDGL